MKNFLLALMVVLTTCTLAIAQNNTTVIQDPIGNVKISVKKSSKANNTAVTVVGVDTTDADSTDIDADSSSVSHGSASFSINTDDDDFPFNNEQADIGNEKCPAIVEQSTSAHKVSKTRVPVSDFSSSFGQSQENSESELLDC